MVKRLFVFLGMKRILSLSLVGFSIISAWGDAMSDWQSRLREKDPTTDVAIGDEWLRWGNGVEKAYNELGEDVNFASGYYRFKCGAELHRTAAGYRLDINGLATRGISSIGDIAIRVSGDSAIGESGICSENGSLLLFGTGRISVAGKDSCGIHAADNLSICGPSITVSGFDVAVEAACGDLLISGSAITLQEFARGALYADYQANVLGSVVTMASTLDGACGIDADTVVVDGSIVSAVTHGTCLSAWQGLAFSHSYITAARTANCSEDDTYYSLAAIEAYGTLLDSPAYISFDSCCARIWSHRQCLSAPIVEFGNGSYRIGSRQGGGEHAIMDYGYDTDARCAVEVLDQCVIDGGDVKICSPGGIGIRGYGKADNVIVRSGRLESVASLNVKTDLAFDAAVVALYVVGLGVDVRVANSLTSTFCSTALVGAYNSGRLMDLKGAAYCAISGGWYDMSYRQTGGTVIVDGATYGLVADKAVITGGSFHGSIRSIDDSRATMPVVNGSDVALSCIPYVATEIGNDRKVSQNWAGILPSYYGTVDLYADGANKLYFWLPEGTVIGGGTGTGGGADTGGGDSGTGGGQTDDPGTVVPTGKLNISVSQPPYLAGADMLPRTEFSAGDQLWCSLWGVKVTLDGVQHCYDKPVKVRTTLSNDKYYDYIIQSGLGKGDNHILFLLDESLDLAEGDYTLTCELDPDGEIEETTRADNKCVAYFKVVNSGSTSGGGGTGTGGGGKGDADKWNLQVYDFGMYVHGADNCNYPRTEFLVGEPMLYYADIRSYKNGVLAQSPGNVKSYEELSSGTTWTSDWEDGVQSGRECWYTYMPKLPVGEYTLEYTMDPNGAFQDCNPADNSKSVRFRIVDKPAYNLVFDESLRLTNAKRKPYQSLTSLTTGQEVWVNVAFHNATGYAVPSQVECLYRLYANGREVASFTRTCTLDTETRITDSFRLDEMIALPTGDCKLTCQLDSGNAVPETNESDNMKECSFTVKYVPKFEPKGVFFPKKAVTLRGALLRDGTPIGIVELKVAKQRNQQCKVSGKLTGLDGKKKTVKGSCSLESYAGIYHGKWFGSTMKIQVPDIGTFNLQVGANGFVGTCGNYTLETMAVGGNLRAATPKFSVAPTFALGVPGELKTFEGHEFVPVGGVPVQLLGSRWGFGKAATIRYAKVRGSNPAEYALQGFDDPEKPNISGLKLNYSSKKGTFKGSFKVYALDRTGARPKLKKHVVNVSGCVVDGVGYGTATCKKPSCSFAVSVK